LKARDRPDLEEWMNGKVLFDQPVELLPSVDSGIVLKSLKERPSRKQHRAEAQGIEKRKSMLLLLANRKEVIMQKKRIVLNYPPISSINRHLEVGQGL